MHHRLVEALTRGAFFTAAWVLTCGVCQAQQPIQNTERSALKWPPVISELRAGPSESTISAELPSNVRVNHFESEPLKQSAATGLDLWRGVWRGWACFSAQCDVKIAIENLSTDKATVVYAAASSQQRTTESGEARFIQNELHLKLSTGATLALRLRNDGDMDMSLWANESRLLSFGVLTQKPFTYSRSIERVPLPKKEPEGGMEQSLEMVIYRPQGAGPFATLVFNHGSTGDGDRSELFSQTWASPEVGRFFTDKGWQVVFPQRRGRGRSDGVYDEGFEADRSRYSCKAEYALPGLERAMADLDAVMSHLRTRADVNMQRLLIGGVSRGGILSLTYAGTRTQPKFLGVLNFVGGWVGDRCADADSVNTASFIRGATFPGATLWLYGDSDSFYSLAHSRKNFDAFIAAGGKGSFESFEPLYRVNGHFIHMQPKLWSDAVTAYLQSIEKP